MQKNNWKKHPVSSLCLFLALSYYYLIFSSYIPTFVYHLQLKNGIYTNGMIQIEYQVLAYLLGLIPIIILLLPLLKQEFFINFNKICKNFIVLLILALIMNALFFTFITYINDGNFISSTNENGLNVLYQQNPFLHHFMVIILAPCLEELVFRGIIFRYIREKKNFWLATLCSSVLFGFIHVSSSVFSGNFVDGLYLILYAGLGFLFCCTYEYNKTIYACIIMHILYNAYSVFM